ncbi:uncharacterized protein LOC144175539 [Haemaphysalis longicornis]
MTLRVGQDTDTTNPGLTACKTADRHRLLIGGDFNSADPAWGYSYSLAKGRNLSQDAHELDLVLITEPAHPTRIGNSVSRDTTPDLTFIKNFGSQPATWHNTSTDLGSDHLIIEIKIPLPGAHHAGTRKFKWIDWNDFRKLRESQHDENPSQITDIDAWCRDLTGSVEAATKEIETELEVDKMDSRLAHMIEAKNSILARWKKQRLNRKLRKKIAELNRNMEEHCRELCKQQWHELCNAINGQMHNGKAWNILRQLLDETKTKSHQRDRLAKLIHKEIMAKGETAVKMHLLDKYVPRSTAKQHGPYTGETNEALDRDISIEEVRTALYDLNSRSAPGPDRVTNRTLRNLDDQSIEALTDYYNECWKTGKLPRQWKKAKMILIPKPGKPPDPENLRPISLTSCVGKVLEHVLLNRWQKYLERIEAFPHTIIGFRQHLGTQDAMLQLKHQVIDGQTSEYAGGSRYAVAVVDAAGITRSAASITCVKSEEAEEVAIALALADQGCTTVLSDSRQAVRNYAKGEISPKAARILERADLHNRKHITWFPAHEVEIFTKHVSATVQQLKVDGSYPDNYHIEELPVYIQVQISEKEEQLPSTTRE